MKIKSFFGQFFSGLWGGGLSDYSGLQESTPSVTLNKEEPYIPPEAGMQLSAVWSCINLLSETMATLPLVIYEVKRNGDKIPARDTRLWQVLHNPNQIMTAHDFWLCMSMNRFLTGNAYALIHRDGTGALMGLTPLASGQMEVAALDGQVIYQYNKDGKYTYFTSDQILHWKGVGNGVVGLSTFDYMRATTNEMKNAQKNASALYGNGNQLTGIVTVDRVIKGQQLVELRNRFRELGAFNGDSWINFLPADMKYQQVAMSAADAQLLETRQFGVEEIGRWFGVPAALINSCLLYTSDAADELGCRVQDVRPSQSLGIVPLRFLLQSSTKRIYDPERGAQTRKSATCGRCRSAHGSEQCVACQSARRATSVTE